ncbi:MAG: mannitol dehydrogenase family protein [Hyphomicrobiales bacterium]|nr:mannitol dehydrogenase family protein [Hyphomicrobiales bacterium]
MTARLSDQTLGLLPKTVRTPGYDRRMVRPGIVHLGVGAFHRAHQAVYIDGLLADDPNWGIVGASLRRPDTRDALASQDGLYAAVARDGSGDAIQIVGSLKAVVHADEDRGALTDALTAADTRIVSLTVTEKGYCHDPATGELQPGHPDVVHDLQNPETPRSAPGFLVAALAERRRLGRPAFTVLSCDNLPSNGSTARQVITALARLREPALADWIESEAAFPSTMVDRIVPATTDADRAAVAEALGVTDAWPVVTEPFSQWVVEDNFPTGRPHFEDAGVQMVVDVAPYELMKLRTLNGAHSTLAYVGYLAGFETVAEAIGDPALRALIHRLMTDEVIPTLDVPDVDLGGYRDALISRFENPALKHRTYQIAMDGSQKLPQRLLGTIRARLDAGGSFSCLALGVAAWMRYASGVDEQGAPIAVQDPLAERLAAIHAEVGDDPSALVSAYLGVENVFGSDLRDNADFIGVVKGHLTSLYACGARETARALAG